MTSLLRTTSQILDIVKYFKSLGATTEYTVSPTATLTAVMTSAQWSAAVTGTASGASGIQYRDMGKYITVVNSRGIDIAKYALVQTVNGSDTEGVPGIYTTKKFVKIWNADATGLVTVARVG